MPFLVPWAFVALLGFLAGFGFASYQYESIVHALHVQIDGLEDADYEGRRGE